MFFKLETVNLRLCLAYQDPNQSTSQKFKHVLIIGLFIFIFLKFFVQEEEKSKEQEVSLQKVQEKPEFMKVRLKHTPSKS